MKASERRQTKRVPIRILVKCVPPGSPEKRNGHSTRGWAMWAHNIADDGVGLRWSKEWATQNCPHCLKERGEIVRGKDICLCTPPADTLKKGQEVQLDDLIYTDKGSKPMRGRIQWVRPSRSGKTYDVGIFITSRDHLEYFRTLEWVVSS